MALDESKRMRRFWDFLRDPDSRGALALIGGAIAAVVVAGWAYYTYDPTSRSKSEQRADGADAEEWDKELYNPQPTEGDVVLPMPCGGGMTFRKIETEAAGALGDQGVFLGSADPQNGYQENRIKAHVAESFPGDRLNTRYFLLGKYEVTELQFHAVMGDKCLQAEGLLPKTMMSWFDAVAFAHRYTLWLLENARERLPRDGDTIGFARLPTEAEWEFAARGGRQVSTSEFEDKTFPMPEGIGHYVQFQISLTDQGNVRRVGQLKPNPLGLHDMLGNVDEMAFDLFRLTKHSRFHGQAGAYVVRGGNYTTNVEQIRASYRAEVPFYHGPEGAHEPDDRNALGDSRRGDLARKLGG